MAIARATLTTSAASIYTSSGSSATTVIFFCNYSVAAVTVDVHIVPNAGTAGTDNQIVKEVSINAGDTYMLNVEKIVLDNGDEIQALASAGSSVTATVSYVGI